jgi:C4-dicarboxylate-specific signal transduction histidine kinase
MVTLGEMAGGIAHEINNPITIISGFSIKLIEELEKDKFDKEKLLINLKKIRDNAQRVALIIKGLKDFSVQGDDNTIIENILVQKIIDDTLSLCAEKFGARKIQLKLNIVANLKAHCRPTQISQVLMNLLNNCYDALEDQKNPQIEITAKKIKESVIINIIDNGTGIPKAIQDKIMQPFFTTKEISKGVGLGLSISQGLVEANEGTLRFDPDSSPTCFELMLKPASS